MVAAVAGLIIGAAAFAQPNPTLSPGFARTAAAVAPGTASPLIQEVARRPIVKLFLTGTVERASQKIPIEKAGRVRPGEVVKFTMNSVNEGSAPAHQYRAVGQIPQGAVFVAGSAAGERVSHISYSIDGGQSFSATPMIEERQPDGSLKKVPAPLSMYKQVRFEWVDPLAAGGNLVASYQVRIK
jgi:uncharacterized repeat protein (TIGR01451 family)